MLSFSLVLSHIFVHFISRDCVVGLTVTAAEMLHRRRIYTEETEFIQILAVLTILHRDDLKNIGLTHPFLRIILVQFILFLISSWCKTAIAGQGI